MYTILFLNLNSNLSEISREAMFRENLLYKLLYRLFSNILEADTLKQLINLLETETSEYWKNHYRFDKLTPLSLRKGAGRFGLLRRGEAKKLGTDTINIIIINTIVPFLFIYGKERGKEKSCDNALSFLEKLEPEKNSIISNWNSIGVPAKNAFETQALLQLKNEYCSKKKCLDCNVGSALLK